MQVDADVLGAVALHQRDAERLVRELKADPPDGLLLVLFYNRSLQLADLLLQAAAEADLPTVFYIGLGVKHGSVAEYRRPGVYFIQSLDNMDAIEYGMRMIQARKLMRQSLLLSITEAKERREGIEKFFGMTVRVIPFREYAAEFERVTLGKEARDWIKRFTGGAQEIRRVSRNAQDNAARAHFALKKLLADNGADGLTMSRWASVGTASSLTSSGSTKSRPSMAAQALVVLKSAILPRGLAPK